MVGRACPAVSQAHGVVPPARAGLAASTKGEAPAVPSHSRTVGNGLSFSGAIQILKCVGCSTASQLAAPVFTGQRHSL